MKKAWIIMERENKEAKATPMLSDIYLNKADAEVAERDHTEYKLYEDTTYFLKEIYLG